MSLFKEIQYFLAIYGAWALIFWLAISQALWLLGIDAHPISRILSAVILTGIKYWTDKGSLEERNEKSALIRLLLLTGGRLRSLTPESQPMGDSDNLPLWLALKSDPEDWKSYTTYATHQRSQVHLLRVGAYARNRGLQNALEDLDKAILSVSRQIIGAHSPTLLLHIRLILLNHLAERYQLGATKQPMASINAIKNLAMNLNEDSAVRVFLEQISRELGFNGHLATYKITWDDIESWLNSSPPMTLDDLNGQAGRKVRMELPEILRAAIEHDRNYKGGKFYDM